MTIGLHNTAGTNCNDASCNGKLTWDDGSSYTHGGLTGVATEGLEASLGQYCFRIVNKDNQPVAIKDGGCGEVRAFACSYETGVN